MALITIIHDGYNEDTIDLLSQYLTRLEHEISVHKEPIGSYNTFFIKVVMTQDVIILATTNRHMTEEEMGQSLLWRMLSTLWNAFTDPGTAPTTYFALPLEIDSGFGPLPDALSTHRIVVPKGSDLKKVASEINDQTLAFLTVRDQNRQKVQARIESNLASFVDPVIESLTQREKRDYHTGKTFHALGLLALCGALAFGISGINWLENTSDIQTAKLIYLGVNNLAIFAVLLIICKYSFLLGKSFTHESFKCADRVHAIKFGQFYLRAFGDQATGAEIREVFQDWNISSPSTFAELDASSFDPRIEERVTELVKASIAAVKDGKKE